MSSFCPNLPNENVKIVVMSTIDREICSKIQELGINIIPTEKVTKLLSFEQTHGDIQFLHYDKDTVYICRECVKLKESLSEYFKNINTLDYDLNKKYPYNVPLNCVILDNKMICNTKTIDKNILNKAYEKDLQIINVNQGYTKCSTAIVSNDAIITSDNSIYNSCSKYIDVLKISEGHIKLKGTNYGFIGGCSFKYNYKDLMFTGNIQKHPDYNNIKSFCLNHNVDIHSLTSGELIDLGSVIPIK